MNRATAMNIRRFLQLRYRRAAVLVAVACLAQLIMRPSLHAQPSVNGQWSGVINWPSKRSRSHAADREGHGLAVVERECRLVDPVTQQFSQPDLPKSRVLFRFLLVA